MGVMLRTRRRRRPRLLLYLAPPLAALLCAWLLLAGGGLFGTWAYVGMAVVLLAVAFGLGFRAWLASVALMFACYFVASLALYTPTPLRWESVPAAVAPRVLYPSPDEPSLARLRAEQQLDAMVAGAGSDLERLRRVVHWANGRFAHDSNNAASKADALTILAEAAQGQRFRCVEFSVVTAAAAQSLGLPARVLHLKRADMETARAGAGHVVAEVWLPSWGKWVMADGQWDVVPVAGGLPLNAVELQRALAERRLDLRVSADLLPIKEATYLPWVAPYLYHFDYNLDQRPGGDLGVVMLAPAGAPEPRNFQGTSLGAYKYFLHDPALFYQAP